MGRIENNGRAKYYKLTSAGRHQLEAETKRWGRIALAIADTGSLLREKLYGFCSLGEFVAQPPAQTELDEEVRSHEVLLADEKIRAGMSESHTLTANSLAPLQKITRKRVYKGCLSISTKCAFSAHVGYFKIALQAPT